MIQINLRTMKKITVGLLYPRSSLYPGIGFDVVEAFRCGLKHFEADAIELVTQNIGIGGVGNEVSEKVERMLVEHNPDILVAFLDHFAAEKVEPLCKAANCILIVMETGGTIPVAWKSVPGRYHITLDAAFGSRLTGSMAGGTSAALATSFYDGGYLSCNALTNGLTEHGGSICYNYVAPFRFEEFDIKPLQEAIETLKPEALLTQMSIDMGALFLSAYKDAGLAGSAKFLASPFLLEESFLDTLEFPFEGITGCVPWSRNLETSENKVFMQVISEEAGREASCFTALAWDTCRFVTLVAAAIREHKGNRNKVAEALKGTTMQSTRGLMELDDATNYFTAPLYYAELVPSASGSSMLRIKDEVPERDTAWKSFTSLPISGIFSRWTNTYLCTQ
jgi:branched-chain amino acid transport system substrate-binding protein